jgi:hypothetical protein
LNEYGKNGWELVSVVASGYNSCNAHTTLYFKRPLVDNKVA